MLVLSRKQNESVVLTSPGREGLVTITVVAIRGGRVKLGFDAADDVPIHRSEVRKQRRVNGQPHNRPQTRGVAAKETMDRWEDDGGGAAGPPESPVANRKMALNGSAAALISLHGNDRPQAESEFIEAVASQRQNSSKRNSTSQ